MKQPVPEVSRDDVERIMERDFRVDQVEMVKTILGEYTEVNPNRSYRVQLAVLKLADGNIEKVRSNIETAKRDFRDVLAYAEYPEYFATINPGREYSIEEKNRIIENDWKQYTDWLNR